VEQVSLAYAKQNFSLTKGASQEQITNCLRVDIDSLSALHEVSAIALHENSVLWPIVVLVCIVHGLFEAVKISACRIQDEAMYVSRIL